jgi:serine/threonine-protein kinase
VEKLLAGNQEPSWQSPAAALFPAAVEFVHGDTVAHYRIVDKLGAGGMGVVYRARDTKLERYVALKVLPSAVAQDPERLARFAREARVLASLNHPNIAAIHGLEEAAGKRFLVLELVEGETLAQRMAKGPLLVDEALQICRQIAEGLEAAHEKGIIHRDLKPANVKITPEGKVKVLDFGLATTFQEEIAAADPSHSPTITNQMTRPGVILGTAAYMSPEQASGKQADKRADIWSFGVLLWELLTGHRLFEGETVSHTLAEVLRGPIDFDKLPRATPPAIRGLLGRCLDRNVKNRLRDIGEARIGIEAALACETSLLEGAPELGDTHRLWLGWSVADGLAVGLTTISFLHFREKPPAPNALPELALSIVPSSGGNLVPVGGLNVDRISPDGSTVLYRATDGRFHLRRLSSLQDQLMPRFDWYGDLFWAPDSKSIAVPTVSGLMKMDVPNGSPELVAVMNAGRGGSWSDKGMILVAGLDSSPGGVGLYGVPAAGGKPISIVVPGLKAGAYYEPEFLPGSDDFLFAFAPLDAAGTQVFMATLRGGNAIDPRLLLSNDTAGAFTSAGGGRILFVRSDNLYAQRLDVKGRRLIGDTELVQERVASNPKFRNAYFSVSNSGTVVWRSGTAVISQVTIFDRKGNRIGTAGAPGPVERISLSHDEAHILVSSEAGSWVMESNGTGRVSLGNAGFRRVWSPDDSSVIEVKGLEIVQRSLVGSQNTREFAAPPASDGRTVLHDISADGRRILYSAGTSLFSLSLDGHGPEQVVEQKIDNAGISPNGAWAVYNANTEPGIYVHPLMSPGLRRQIANSGTYAVWRKDGKEIIYATEDRDQARIWSVRVDRLGTQLRFAPPEDLFSVSRPLGTASGSRPLDVSRDGSRIYFLQSTEEPDSGVIHVRTHAIH